MPMNRTIAGIGAGIVSVTVSFSAVCLIADFSFGSYFVCVFLPMGYVMMAAVIQPQSDSFTKRCLIAVRIYDRMQKAGRLLSIWFIFIRKRSI